MGVCCVKEEDVNATDRPVPSSARTAGPQVRTSTLSNSPRTETAQSFDYLQHSVIKQQRRMTAAEREEQTARFLNFKSAKAFKQVERFKDLYETKKQLGQGSFGQVRLGTHRKSGVPCAIKIIKKSLLSQAEIYETLMKQELEVLEKTDHPHITRVFELLEDKRQYYVIMELMPGGNLLEKVIEMKTITEPVAADIIK